MGMTPKLVSMKDHINVRSVDEDSNRFPIREDTLKPYIPSIIMDLEGTNPTQSSLLTVGPSPSYCSPYTRA